MQLSRCVKHAEKAIKRQASREMIVVTKAAEIVPDIDQYNDDDAA